MGWHKPLPAWLVFRDLFDPLSLFLIFFCGVLGLLLLGVILDGIDALRQAWQRRRPGYESFDDPYGSFRVRRDSHLRQRHWREVEPSRRTFDQSAGGAKRPDS